ncbi:MAG: hypothetical protein IJ191_03140 [Treponema sp.]|nr:hypothetical protein [Treponema sp.]
MMILFSLMPPIKCFHKVIFDSRGQFHISLRDTNGEDIILLVALSTGECRDADRNFVVKLHREKGCKLRDTKSRG